MAMLATSRIRPVPSFNALAALESALNNFRISPQVTAIRHASHQAQGRANKAKDGAGKRLGAKKTGGEYVVPGNILYRQRGTLWYPGDNCYMGRDHTVHAGAPGYVTYYRDPLKHPKRKYIGIVFEKTQTLPQPPNTVRRRQLGRLAYQSKDVEAETKEESASEDLQSAASPDAPDSASNGATFVADMSNESRDKVVSRGTGEDKHDVTLHFRPGQYMYREANWEIGRAAERSKAAMAVKPFKPNDRFAAWRKRSARQTRSAERRAMTRGGKGKKR